MVGPSCHTNAPVLVYMTRHKAARARLVKKIFLCGVRSYCRSNTLKYLFQHPQNGFGGRVKRPKHTPQETLQEIGDHKTSRAALFHKMHSTVRDARVRVSVLCVC